VVTVDAPKLNERERLELLQTKTQEIVAGLPAWDGESPAVLVSFTDPVTRQRLGHWFTPATPAPQPQARVRHLHAVREVS
jgi:molybdopterin-guanine dinucleotide biosynthesis protein A